MTDTLKIFSPSDTYDEKTCITAGELRDTGWNIPANVPDCAWIPRGSIIPKIGDISEGEQGVMKISVMGTFTCPFKWLEGTYTIEKD
jgi:hypothetical protein